MGFWEGRDRSISHIHRKTKPMKYTATVSRVRLITVEAETMERATRLLQRRMEPGENIITVQTSLL